MSIKYKREKVVCVFCGEERIIEHGSDDGMDWEGHQRGRYESWTVDDGCTCKWGRLEKEKADIKPMCRNCSFMDKGYCTNKKQLKSISQMFDVGSSVHIAAPDLFCQNWTLDRHIFDRLFKGTDHIVGKDFVSAELERRGLKQ